MADSPGRRFFDGHLALIAAGKIDEMVDHDYAQDAILITFFGGLDTPPPITVRGRAELKKFFHSYMDINGQIDIKSLDFADHYDGKDGGICFQATFTTRLGLLKAADAWFMKDGQISVHHGFFIK